MNPAAPPPPDSDRDAWLSQALRHAPDADVAPPPSLSEMILREAQAKAKPAGAAVPRPAAPFWSRAWDWMARPAVGAGAASVMLASLVGVMMWNRPLEEMSPRPKLDVPTAAPSPTPVAADAASASGAAGASAAAPTMERARALQQAASSEARTATAINADAVARRERLSDAAKAGKPSGSDASLVARKRELLEQKRAVEAERRAEPGQGAAELRDDKQRATLKAPPDAMAKAARTAESMSPAPPVVEPVTQMAAAAPAARVSPVSPAAMPPPMPAPVAAPSPAATEQAQAGNVARSTPAPSAQVAQPSRQAAAASVPMSARFAAGGLSAAPAERSFVNLRASLAAEPAPWRWSRDGTAPRNVDDSLSAFLAEVDSVAANRWQTAAAGLADASANGRTSADSVVARDKLAANATASVRLLHNGQPVHLLRLDGHVLHWDRLGADPASATVTLTDAELQAVRRALDKLAP